MLELTRPLRRWGPSCTRPDRLELQLCQPGEASPSTAHQGFGLQSMAFRARLAGGLLSRVKDGYNLVLEFPLEPGQNPL